MSEASQAGTQASVRPQAGCSRYDRRRIKWPATNFSTYGIEKIGPTWVHLFDEAQLPRAVPFFELLLTSYGRGKRFALLAVNELDHAVPAEKSRE